MFFCQRLAERDNLGLLLVHSPICCARVLQTAAYEHYDIVIWSATSMQWVELKMRELGVLSHPDYKIAFLMDCQARYGQRTAATATLSLTALCAFPSVAFNNLAHAYSWA